MPTPTRAQWVNTIAGIIDAAFILTPEELFAAEARISELCVQLRIPERPLNGSIPAPLMCELASGFYAVQLDACRNATNRTPRPANSEELVVDADIWRNAIVALITSAYTDLTGPERLLTAYATDLLLHDLGVPYRAARFIPDAVVREHRNAGGK